ncbi:MAG: hypothetical protein AAB113_09640, partial [Candidatus Eisenbacteria bacterium]
IGDREGGRGPGRGAAFRERGGRPLPRVEEAPRYDRPRDEKPREQPREDYSPRYERPRDERPADQPRDQRRSDPGRSSDAPRGGQRTKG